MDALQKTVKVYLLIAATALLSGGCGKAISENASGEMRSEQEKLGKSEVKSDFFAMDTHITFTVYEADSEAAEEALKKAEEKMAELESAWSVTKEGSEIYEINHSRGEAVTISDETAKVISYALDMAKKTEGALEPTIYPVVSAWGFTTEENRIPEDEELKDLLSHVGYEKVRLSGNQVTLPEGMEFDLGAVGKGYAGDEIAELFKEQGISSALLDLGGNIQTIGSKPDGSAWRLGIRDPFGEGAIGVLSVSEEMAVVTSGSYERYFVDDDGKEYGHIIDPATGYPIDNELASITIIAKEGKLADALSTSMMVKGLEGAKGYWRKHRDFEMIAVTKDGEIYLMPEAGKDFSLSGSFGNMKVQEIM